MHIILSAGAGTLTPPLVQGPASQRASSSRLAGWRRPASRSSPKWTVSLSSISSYLREPRAPAVAPRRNYSVKTGLEQIEDELAAQDGQRNGRANDANDANDAEGADGAGDAGAGGAGSPGDTACM